MKNLRMLLVAVLAIALLLVGCASTSAQPADAPSANAGTSAVEKIKADGKLTVLTNAGFAPYEFLGEDNTVIGVDIEIAAAIAKELGVELEVVDMDFDSIIFAVQSGKGDLGIAGMTNTEERRQTVDFSINYVDSLQMIIVPEGSSITGPADLTGKSVGVQMGTTGDLFASESLEGVNVQRYKTGPDAGAELAAGKLDAVMIDAGPAAQIAKANPGLVVLETPATEEPEQYAIAIAKGNDALKALVDGVLEKLIADGQIQAWIDEYNAISAGE